MIPAYRPPLSKYDYGWIRDGGIWNSGGLVVAAYWGPPHSFWYPIIAFLIWLLPKLAAAAVVGGGIWAITK